MSSGIRAPESLISFYRTLRPNFTLAVESNGKGVMGFLVDLPGGFVRGRTEGEAISKVGTEVSRFLAWANLIGAPTRPRGFIVQRASSNSTIEDGDTQILLDADRGKMRPEEFRAFSDLALFSGQSFTHLYQGAKLKDWVDPARSRSTFYGPCPDSIEAAHAHVRKTQAFYVSRLGLSLQDGDFMMMRRLALSLLHKEFEAHNGRSPVEVDGELWTLKKVFRRFIWHDRIHAKSISRMMRKQQSMDLISEYPDPFHFSSLF